MKLFKLVPLLLITCFFIGINEIQASSVLKNNQEQPVPKPIRKIVKEIEKANVFVLHQPEQVSPLLTKLEESYFLLSKLATSVELENLIETHKNAVVRMYAFKALATQVYDIPPNIMMIVNNDTSTIDCISRDKTLKAPIKTLVQNFLN